MRLLHTETGHFHELPNHTDKPYAILSHRWDSIEQDYEEVYAIQASYRDHPSIYKTILSYLGRIILYISVCRLNLFRAATSPDLKKSTSPLLGAMHALLNYAHDWAMFSALRDRRLSAKIRNACAYARAEGHQFLWIDSCCIDKRSSAELSEAINAMYQWYGIASVCYAYLSDVDNRSSFEKSNWHTRGWTLQELLAPNTVVFLSKRWQFLGTKTTLVRPLWAKLRIDPQVLTKYISTTHICTAQLMSWTAARETSREEDRAYCLMGLFDVNMPTLYGEGSQKAFARLQEAILQRKRDPTIFAWSDHPRFTSLEDLGSYVVDRRLRTVVQKSSTGGFFRYMSDFSSPFAVQPSNFRIGRLIYRLPRAQYDKRLERPEFADHDFWSIPSSSAHDAIICLPYVPLRACLSPEAAATLSASLLDLFLMPLPCATGELDEGNGLIAIVCRSPETSPAMPMSPRGQDGGYKVLQAISLQGMGEDGVIPPSRLVILTPTDLARCRNAVRPGGLLSSSANQRAPSHFTPLPPIRTTYDIDNTDVQQVPPAVLLADWCQSSLSAAGFVVEPLPSTGSQDDLVLGYTLRKDDGATTIRFEYNPLCLVAFAAQLRFRVGLVDIVTDKEAEVEGAGPTTTLWTEWRVVEEGSGYTQKGCLTYPRSNGQAQNYFRVTLQWKSRNVYELGLDFVTDVK